MGYWYKVYTCELTEDKRKDAKSLVFFRISSVQQKYGSPSDMWSANVVGTMIVVYKKIGYVFIQDLCVA